ncbi:3-aminobutyryl-CoA ammonia lyase [bacterium]|nr:MAG: 3-aminobutyryl-CoA ammonia lyase [bacterium]
MAPRRYQVTHRVRMGQSDAHYDGDLVDGARILALFGDVATDLLIQSDGDEGLFRAYASVEFLAPVRAGDFLEVEGEITRFGKSSREMRFEARKVIEAERGSDPPGRARVLKRPILVCRAVGTCVVLGGGKRSKSELCRKKY